MSQALNYFIAMTRAIQTSWMLNGFQIQAMKGHLFVVLL
jgi:hypothetical protein